MDNAFPKGGFFQIPKFSKNGLKPGSCFALKSGSCFAPKSGSCFAPKRDPSFAQNTNQKTNRICSKKFTEPDTKNFEILATKISFFLKICVLNFGYKIKETAPQFEKNIEYF